MNNFHMREGKVEFRWKRWRNKKRQEVSSCLMVLFSGVVLLGAGGVALAGPTGGQITGGSGTITTPNGTTTNINQQSNVLNINWQDFSIGANETVNFYQPGSTSVAINRVIGGVPSYLAGALNANGRVFILNSAGITFTGTSQVNVGALLATTAMTVNGDPTQAASYSGTGYGAVINQGSISVSNGGFAILAAPYVQNTGFIKADLGTIALAGTNQFTLDLSGTGLINFVVPAGAVEQIVSDGKAVGVDNSGTLQARSGQVVISANVASEVINAVVNLNGIVDADAFAPNGQGGAVLVSAAGNINVGGQVTARGDGAGNGGQIVTKAVGADNIEQMAFVSAAGGATGKGGFIEVSGKQVGLHGNIDPGSGGSLYIDPNNIHVIAANPGVGTLVGSNQTPGSTIGSDFIENQLAHGANVNLVADHNVFFDALADDHQLVGGNGNLNIVAASGNITFAGTNDAIVQGGGFIHMNANGGNIGSSGHAMTLITGVGPTNAGIGVTQAGDIVLKAGNDIHVHNVQVKSSGGSVLTAKFSANAAHNFIASGDISATANAHGSGHEQATASVNIFAHNNINVRNVAVVAQAADTNAGGSQSASAFANLRLNAQASSVAARNLLVSASAFNAADRKVNGQALGSIQANKNIDINGSINVAAAGVGDSSDDSSAHAKANLLLSAVTGHVNVAKDVIVDALAKTLNSSAQATASANINANTGVTINGNVALTASAIGSSDQATQDHAFANLLVHANAGIAINHDVTVAANAHGFGTDRSDDANASATASANITANNIDIGGNVAVNANAVQSGNSDDSSHANAFANLLMHANSGHVNVGRDVTVNAFAQQGGSSSATALAQANIHADSSITVGGNVEVTASAKNIGSSASGARATANLEMNASDDNVNVNGNVGANAVALAEGFDDALACAIVNVFADGDVNISGSVDAHASANQNGTEGSQALATASVNLHPNGDVNVNGGVLASANAFNKGSESAVANAAVHLNISGDVIVNGVVTANAHAVADSIDSDSPNNGALALASIDVNGDPVVLGGIDEHATATSHGSVNQANALANVRVHGSSNVSILGDVTVVAKALDDSTASGKGAVANAHLVVCAFDGLTSSQNLTITGDVNLSASANDKALHAGANALASGTLYGRHQVLQSSSEAITVTAVSHVAGSGSATNATANARLLVQVPVGNASLGSVTVNALAVGNGIASTHHVIANAIFSGQAQTIVVKGPATVRARASGTNDTFINPMKAHAVLTAHAANAVRFESGLSASAVANGSGAPSGPGAIQALTSVDIVAESSIDIDDHLNVGALAIGQNAGLIHATANAHLDGVANGPNIFMSGSANVHATASGNHVFAHSSGPVANALFTANGHQESFDDVTVTALTNASANTMLASANANFQALNGLDIDGIVTVRANAHDSSPSAHNIAAHAVMSANAANVVSIGGVDVRASAVSEGSAVNVSAIAFANIAGTQVTVGNTIVKSLASGHGGIGVSKATLLVTDSSFIHMTGSINVEADLVGSGFSPIGAEALASLNGHTITVDGPTRVVAKTTGSHAGTGSIFANALLNVHALGNAHFLNSIDVEALVNGSDAHTINANPVVQINAASLEVDGNLKVLANAQGSSANSVIAAPVLNLSNAVQVVTNGIELDALAHGHGVNLVLANAKLVDSSHTSFNDHGLTKVFAKASGSSDGLIQADATLQVNVPNNASFGGGIDVVASAFGITSFSSHGAASIVANAIANIQASNHLTFGNDVTVTALASGNTATKVTAQALGLFRGINGVNLTTGNIDVAATANAGSRVSFGTGAAVASLDIFAENGGVDLGGDVDVTANVSYQPNSSAMFNGVIVGNAFALANAAIVANNGGVTVDGNIDVNATLLDKSGSLGSFFSVASFGQPGDQFLAQTAGAILNISAHNGDVTLGNVTVTANDQLNGTQDFFQFSLTNIFAGAIALANISAPSGSVDMGAVDVEATMNAPNVNSVGFKLGVVGALAVLNVQADSDISAGSVTVKALANVGGIQTFSVLGPLGIGDAVAIANFSAGDSVTIDGNATVEASYNGVFAQHGLVIAALNVNAFSGSVSIDGNVTVDGTLQLTGKFGEFGSPTGEFPSDAIVFADAVIHADSSVKVTGDVDVNANVQAKSVKFTAFGQAGALLTGSSIDVGGNVDVEALTNVTSANSVIADARAGLFGFFGVEVDGSVTVNATAHHGNPSFFVPPNGTESGVVISKAVLSASADDGSVNIGHGVTVTANTLEEGSESGLAFAEASANIFGRFGVTVGNIVTVRADLTDFADNGSVLTSSNNIGPFGLFTYSGAGGLASAQVHIEDSQSAGVSLGGLTVTANATTLNPEFSGNAIATADAQVISNHGPINIAGSVVGLAHANDQGDGGALAVTLIDLEPASSLATTTASLHIGGGVAMNALAELGTMAEGNAMAVAVLNADADSGAVRIDGNVNILANARILSTPSTPEVLIYPFGQAAAYANANLEGASGVSVGGGIAVTAKLRSKSNFDQSSIEFALGDNDSFSVEWGHAAAIAQLDASHGGIAVSGVTVASASAVGQGFSDAGTVAATAEVEMVAEDNIRVGGALTRAFASGTENSNASANANTKLDATSGSINAGPGGLTATAIALASNARHANAQANVAADASSNIFIRGNVISFALAVSGGSGNTAHAKTHLAAGGATSSSDGPSSQFGNITVIGNIGAFAFADATSDVATASVEIFAHNNLLIVGNDPIASARVGPSGGTTFAFRQAHFTTQDGPIFGPGGTALADIDIRAGGFVAVFPTSSLSHVEKLYSLPTDDPTLNSSLGLTIIPLSVDGEDCGVLGIAGKDQAAINKALGCHHKPINVSDLTDTGP